ncbi:MAG TPA: hypothetical protein VFF69_08990 [Phycisphaerales bacterium]|nr:hypothetical protein [Phycisphaerales bacterium]
MWWQLAVTCIGLWLMFAPAALAFGRPAAESAWVSGPVVASIATIAMWSATRAFGRANIPFGAWLVLAPAFIDHPPQALANSMACGLLILVLGPRTGARRHRFGGGWPSLWRGDAQRAPGH